MRGSLPKKHLALFTEGLILGKLQYLLPLMAIEHEDTLKPLKTAWNSALRVITGGLPSTPIPVLHAESGLPPLDILIQEAAGKWLRRLLQQPTLTTMEYLSWEGQAKGLTPFEGLRIAQEKIPEHLLQNNFPEIEQLYLPTPDHFRMLLDIEFSVQESIQDALELHSEGQLVPEADIILWTDGGFDNRRARISGGACWSSVPHYYSFCEHKGAYSPGTSSYQAKCLGLLGGLKALPKDINLKDKSVAILSDSRSLVTHLQGILPKRKKVTDTIYDILCEIHHPKQRQPSSIEIVWIPGHQDVGLNTRADELASTALESSSVTPCLVPGPALKGMLILKMGCLMHRIDRREASKRIG